MAIPFKRRIGDLIAEFFAHTLRFFGSLAAAGAISARFYEPFFDDLYDFFVFIESDFHNVPLV